MLAGEALEGAGQPVQHGGAEGVALGRILHGQDGDVPIEDEADGRGEMGVHAVTVAQAASGVSVWVSGFARKRSGGSGEPQHE